MVNKHDQKLENKIQLEVSAIDRFFVEDYESRTQQTEYRIEDENEAFVLSETSIGLLAKETIDYVYSSLGFDNINIRNLESTGEIRLPVHKNSQSKGYSLRPLSSKEFQTFCSELVSFQYRIEQDG